MVFRLSMPFLLVGTVAAVAGCTEPAVFEPISIDQQCSIDRSLLFSSLGKDQIPALSSPALVPAFLPGSEYLSDEDRVVGIVVGNQAVAVPLNVGRWHEVVNLEVGGRLLVVTHCPLTGSSLAFSRDAVEGAEFGVSGLLFQNNLVMYDRTGSESLWPQMRRGVGCGPRDGTALEMYPAVELTWAGWRDLYPNTLVVSSETGSDRDYETNPYAGYSDLDNNSLLFPLPDLDRRRPLKERVLGILDGGTGGIAFPFGELDRAGELAVLHATVEGKQIVLFWSRSAAGATVYRPRLADGTPLEFEVRDGAYTDAGTGSVWLADGKAIAGPLAGRSLEPVAEAYVAFWFAWSRFQPETALWTLEGPQ